MALSKKFYNIIIYKYQYQNSHATDSHMLISWQGGLARAGAVSPPAG
eukprot:COSAG01_NODE_9275_length_2496_cov_1.895286_8_plen_46_part_01